jgi:hypothetical protein
MVEILVVAPTGGEVITLGPTQMRILEDGSTADHRLALVESGVMQRTPISIAE